MSHSLTSFRSLYFVSRPSLMTPYKIVMTHPQQSLCSYILLSPLLHTYYHLTHHVLTCVRVHYLLPSEYKLCKGKNFSILFPASSPVSHTVPAPPHSRCLYICVERTHMQRTAHVFGGRRCAFQCQCARMNEILACMQEQRQAGVIG